MAEIKSASAIAAKWSRVTPQRSGEYKEGVQNPRRDWEKAAAAAAPTHAAAMVAANAAGSYGKGVTRAGTAKWQNRAVAKGPGRFSEGTMLGGPDYEKGYQPYRDEIEKTTLPPRFPRRDPRNIQRVATIAAALGKRKTG
jgi:hypothetical protein